VVARQFRAVAAAYRIPLTASELAGLRAWDRGVCRCGRKLAEPSTVGLATVFSFTCTPLPIGKPFQQATARRMLDYLPPLQSWRTRCPPSARSWCWPAAAQANRPRDYQLYYAQLCFSNAFGTASALWMIENGKRGPVFHYINERITSLESFLFGKALELEVRP
jgi:hypothetical protein